MPRFIYGTAWKGDSTARFVGNALEVGFRGFDTANQLLHYHESHVGIAISTAITAGLVQRSDLYLQSKFTFPQYQDTRLPYDPNATTSDQVEQSFASSLVHLGTETLDAYLLHAPAKKLGLTDDDVAAWRAMEVIHDSGQVSSLGICNVSAEQLALLCKVARIQPRVVQNRFCAVRGWDRSVRDMCSARNIVYQGFSVLTGLSMLTTKREKAILAELARMAELNGRPMSQIMFRFALELGVFPITGSTCSDHMQLNLASLEFSLARDDVQALEVLAAQ